MYAIPYDTTTDVDPIGQDATPVSGGWMMFVAVWVLCCIGGILTATLGGQPILGIALMAVPTAVGVIASPTFALCCIALVLPLSGSINFQGNLTADRVVGGLAALGILFHCKFLGQGLFVRGSPLIPMLLLGCWASTSALWAPEKPLAFIASLTIMQLCIWGLAVWNAVAYRGNFVWPLRAYAMGMLLVVTRLYLTGGLARIARASGAESRLTIGGTNAQDINPNDFATYLAAGFMVAVYLFLRDPSKLLRVIWAGCAFVFPVMMILTGARSCLVGLAAALAVTGLTAYQFLRSRGMMIGVVIAGILLIGGYQFVVRSQYAKTEAVQRIFDSKMRDKSLDYRFVLMQRGIENILSNPILGTGYKNYTIALRERHVIHNDIMLIGAELGVFGIFLFLYFYWRLMIMSIQTRAPAEKWLLRSMLVFFLITGLAHPVFTLKSFWFFAILAAAAAHRARQLEAAQALSFGTPTDANQAEFSRWSPVHSAHPSYY